PFDFLRVLDGDPDGHRHAEPDVALVERGEKLGAEPRPDPETHREDHQRAARGSRRPGVTFIHRLPSTGTSVSERSSEPSSAKESVNAIGENIRFSTRWNVKIGRNAVITITFAKRIGRPIA